MRFGVSAAVLAGLLLAGCDQLGMGAGNGSNTAAGNAATPVPSADGNTAAATDGNGSAATGPVPEGGATQLTRDYVVGSWSVTGNCGAPEFVFNADGTVSRGGQSYQWSVDGGNLVVNRSGQSESESTPVRVVDQSNMIVTSRDGPIPLRRC
ncbi:MAG: hypothetical protein AB7O91_08515 [Sphingomonas sp.]